MLLWIVAGVFCISWYSAYANEPIPVILYSIDTLRADHCSVYGYERNTTPFIKAWAAEDAVVFERALTQDAWTLPAHMTMLTGLYPKHHGVTKTRALAETVTTLPEMLSAKSYACAGFTGCSWWMSAKFGFDQGFDIYDTPEPYRYCAETSKLAFDWLAQRKPGPFFLFLHNFDVHSKAGDMGYPLPYLTENPDFQIFSREFKNPPPLIRQLPERVQASDFLVAASNDQFVMTQREFDYLIALYDDGIYGADCDFKNLIQGLKEKGVYDQAMIILTSDHGEAFNEHGAFLHGEAYESCARVPLIIKFPQNRFAGRRIGGVVQHVDIMPTVLDTLGMPVYPHLDGQNLLAVLQGTQPQRPYAYTRRFAKEAVSTSDWKLFRDQNTLDQFELYHLKTDPMEQKNVVSTALPTQPALKKELERFYQPNRAGWNFQMTGGATGAFYTLSLKTPGRIACRTVAQTRLGIIADISQKEDGTALEVMARIPPKGVFTWCMQLVDPDKAVTVQMVSDQTVTIEFQDQRIKNTTTTFTLTPAGADAFDNAPSTHEPHLRIWYVQPEGGGAALSAPSPEQQQALEALGYLPSQ